MDPRLHDAYFIEYVGPSFSSGVQPCLAMVAPDYIWQ